MHYFFSELYLPECNISLPQTPVTPSSHFSNSSFAATESLKENKVKDEKLFSLLYMIKEQNTQILKLLANHKAESVQFPEDLFPSFPVSTDDDLKTLEELLQSKDNSNLMVRNNI